VTRQDALVDERGWLYLTTSLGFGLVHTQDVGYAAQAIEVEGWTVHELPLAELESKFQFVRSPEWLQQRK
jgi:hypothetical protein